MSAFEDFGVSPEIIRAITEDGWLLPTPVQAEAIPLILGVGSCAYNICYFSFFILYFE